MKGLYRRKGSKVFWMNFTSKGVNYQRSTGTSDKVLAEKIMERVKAEVVAEVWFDRKEEKKPEHSFSDLTVKYLEWCKGRQRSYEIKKYVLERTLKDYSDMFISEISNSVIEQMQSDLISKGRKVAYINKITAILKHMMGKAYDWDMISESNLKSIRKAKNLKGENKRLRFLSLEESQSLIDSCDSFLKPVVVMALNTGMRKSEILNLTWNQLDLKHGFILLDKTKNGERREIPLNSTLKVLLSSIVRRLDVPFVFCNPQTGKPFQKDWKKPFLSALKKAGIRDFVFHDLRHSFASQLVMAGVDITTVSRLLGHKTLTMTLRYAHLAPSHLLKAVEILDKKQGNSDSNSYNFLTVPLVKEGLQLVTH